MASTTRQSIQEIVKGVKPTMSDRVVNWLNPVKGNARRKARVQSAVAEAMASGAYKGASKGRRATSAWSTSAGDADADLLPDLSTLRDRSRDLVRNNPLAAGAINVKVGNVVGGGLRLNCQIDADYLGMTDEQAEAWERNTEREFRLWAESADCDVARTLNFYGQQELAFRSTLENGDVFAVMPMLQRTGALYELAVQLIEGDRVCNENWAADTDRLSGGVEKDDNGSPVKYHILKQHPGAYRRKNSEWQKVDAFGAATGRRNVLHLYRKMRPGQSRGIPDLAPVIEALKQLGDYTEAELMAALVAGMFTVFVHTEGDFSLEELTQLNGGTTSPSGELKMGNGTVVGLGANEKVDIANPGRPNPAFDSFINAIMAEVAVAIELPREVLLMAFNSSYSASKAAIENAWMFFKARRQWLADAFCRPIYEAWMWEAVAKGRIAAPGFMRDPAVRAAYLGSQWIGPSKPILDLAKEANGRAIMEDRGWTTGAQNTIEMTGGDWDRNHRQRTKEHRRRTASDLEPRINTVVVTDPGDND